MRRPLAFGSLLTTLSLAAGLCAACLASDAPSAPAAAPAAKASPAQEARPAEEAARETLAPGLAAVDALLAGVRVAPGADGVARVRYAALAAHRAPLDAALAFFARTDPARLPDAASRRAYWFNGYNVAMMAAVLDAWGGDPRWSVSADGFAVFSRRVHDFGGHRLALNDVENGVLRGDLAKVQPGHPEEAFIRAAFAGAWEGRPVDPRLHMALNCASVGCPALPSSALRPAGLNAQLDALARAYVDDAGRGAGPQGISQIFEWYAADFPAGPRAFIEAHRAAGGPVAWERFIPYDWGLNVADPG